MWVCVCACARARMRARVCVRAFVEDIVMILVFPLKCISPLIVELSSDKDDPYVTARYEDGKFFYQGEWYEHCSKYNSYTVYKI